jgi:hypothetical protein
MAEQNVTNVKIIAGEQLGGQNLIMRKGIDVKSWKASKENASVDRQEAT